MARVSVAELRRREEAAKLSASGELNKAINALDRIELQQKVDDLELMLGVKPPRIVMPKQKPGRSEQDVETPPEFIAAVEARWGKLTFDLAADASNTKAPMFFDEETDSLAQDWTRLHGNLWLNPPFGDIPPFSRKCAESKGFPSDRRIFLLTPAGVSTNWFYEDIYCNARVIAIQRLRFVGHEADFPKDLILSVFGDEPGFEVWRWKDYGKGPLSDLDLSKGQPGGKAK